ncbi:MAG: hypothetical protein HQL23_00400 [Candidatus Omnitrophica bacterium]|nr:hypothetical protein [Candidatus Omnitrophota bacterium]
MWQRILCSVFFLGIFIGRASAQEPKNYQQAVEAALNAVEQTPTAAAISAKAAEAVGAPTQQTETAALVPALEHRQMAVHGQVVGIVLNTDNQSGIDWEAIVAANQRIKAPEKLSDRWGLRIEFLRAGVLSQEDKRILLSALKNIGTYQILAEQEIKLAYQQPALAEFSWEGNWAGFRQKNFRAHLPVIMQTDTVLKEDAPMTRLTMQPVFNEENPQTVGSGTSAFQMLLPDGYAGIISGVTEDFTTENIRPVPLFGKLPFIGSAFTTREKKNQKTETVIFFTVRPTGT